MFSSRKSTVHVSIAKGALEARYLTSVTGVILMKLAAGS